MTPAAYYNEFDDYAAAWLRNLIAAGHIAPGDVDNRSIEDVKPDDLRGYTQCHFFAGIGVWSYALRLAGWDDSRSVWTGSCPCQPFSAAGAGNGFDDQRHLWPAWLQLIAQCRPGEIFGEQVEAAIRFGWLDLVQTDLEGLGYSFGAFGLPAAGVGAPHIRARLWFVAHPVSEQCLEGRQPLSRGSAEWARGDCGDFGVGDADHSGRKEHGELGNVHFREPDWAHSGRLDVDASVSSGVGHPELLSAGGNPGTGACAEGRARVRAVSDRVGPSSAACRPRPVDRMWDAADWLFCRDGKWRGVEPGTFPLANGAPARVGRLRAYGNAIVPQVAAEFIRAYMECRP